MLKDLDIIATMKSKRLSWVGHVWWGWEQNTPRQRWMDSVHKNLDMLGMLNDQGIETDERKW